MKEKNIYTVTRLTRDIRIVLEDTFNKVWVEGEVSNFIVASSGHTYFSIKDKNSVLNCVMFKNASVQSSFEIENGMRLICLGRISVYDKRGQYQLYVESVEPVGKGSLQVAFEQLKTKLDSEGLFDEKNKKPIPGVPVRVGVVTSPTGAAIRDILKVLRRRFNNVEVLLRPVKVQGPGSKEQISSAINELNEYNRYLKKNKKKEHPVDVIIAGRGGGSLEDLWGFNEEIVARAIADSEIPVVSAVGHETDFTIADFTADVRAATPSAAAEIVVPVKKDVVSKIEAYRQRLYGGVKTKIERFKGIVETCAGSYALREPVNVLLRIGQRIDDLMVSARSSIEHSLEIKQRDMASVAGKLNMLSPLAVLERGYSITMKDDSAVRSVKQVEVRDLIVTKFSDGSVVSKIEKIK